MSCCSSLARTSRTYCSSGLKDGRKRSPFGPSLGGAPIRIARQLLTESLVLGAVGAVAGILLGYAGIRFLLALQPAKFPRLESIAIDGTVLAYTLCASVVATVVFGLAPTYRAMRSNLNEALTERSLEGSASAGSRTSQFLIVAEVALSLMLLVGAGLLMRSFVQLQEVRPGFDADDLLTFSVSLPSTRYSPPQETANFFKRFEERIQTLPGVVSVGTVWPLPLEGQIWTGPYSTPRVADNDSKPMADYRLSTPGYAPTVGARLVEGRYLRDDDRDVVLVDKHFATLNWPSGTAVGQKIGVAATGANFQEFRIAGVVENIRHADLKADGRETVYLAARAWTWADWELAVAVRTTTDPMSLVAPIRKELASLGSTNPHGQDPRYGGLRERRGGAESVCPYPAHYLRHGRRDSGRGGSLRCDFIHPHTTNARDRDSFGPRSATSEHFFGSSSAKDCAWRFSEWR